MMLKHYLFFCSYFENFSTSFIKVLTRFTAKNFIEHKNYYNLNNFIRISSIKTNSIWLESYCYKRKALYFSITLLVCNFQITCHGLKEIFEIERNTDFRNVDKYNLNKMYFSWTNNT